MQPTLLLIDTETTGKWQKNLPIGHAKQPRMVQIAAMLVRPPADELVTLNVMIRPDGFVIHTDAAAIHGITTDMALAGGVAANDALRVVIAMLDMVDFDHTILAGHNIEFDRNILLNELAHADKHEVARKLGQLPTRCTMHESTPICRLPGPYGYKWPKLAEAYKHFTNSTLIGAHNAMTDLRATLTVLNQIDLYNKTCRLATQPKDK